MQFNFPSTAYRSSFRIEGIRNRDTASRAIRRGIKPRETSRVRTSRLISAANFIFGASRANDSASTVSPQCSRGGPDSDTRSRRKSVKPARKSALDREREQVPGGNHVAAVEIGILIGDETKIAVARGYTSLLKRVLQRRRFASNAEISV